MVTLRASIQAYERWLKAQIGPDFVEADLSKKHHKMRSDPFAFLRATYWRWAETILDICPELGDAPEILGIGDTHLENFGTWRDAESRLVWGANDFDDAAIMPYPLDLVRLAASALLARDAPGPPARTICAHILAGYGAGLSDPAALVLEQDHKWLRKAVMLPERDRAAFWRAFKTLKPGDVPQRYARALRAVLPSEADDAVMAPRTAGTGSLGRPRFVARVDWNGGPVLREVKAVVLSGWSLCHAPNATALHIADIAGGRFRAPDPHYRLEDGLLIRRLAPNSRKIEVKDGAADLLRPEMLAMMGREIANCHAGDRDRRPAVQADLARRSGDWLHKAAKAAARHVAREQAEFAAL